MNVAKPSVAVHRFAWLTAALTILLPVATGAVVTTLKAGMVFADWPSSDGYFMFSYPWLSAARDQFVEHGHRLSGSTIGMVSLVLAITAWVLDRRRSVRLVATAIFLAVFCQGMLGGARVLLDQQVMALIHSDFAALVFTLMAILVVITSGGWEQRSRMASTALNQQATLAAAVLVAVLSAQYLMGGFLRHLRHLGDFAWAWLVHPWFALVVILATIVFAITVRRSGSAVLHRCAIALIGLTLSQALLGLATWYVRYGVPSWGVVAQQDSIPQIVICSLHTVLGMLTLMTSVVTLFCCHEVKPIPHASTVAIPATTTIVGAAI